MTGWHEAKIYIPPACNRCAVIKRQQKSATPHLFWPQYLLFLPIPRYSQCDRCGDEFLEKCQISGIFNYPATTKLRITKPIYNNAKAQKILHWNNPGPASLMPLVTKSRNEKNPTIVKAIRETIRKRRSWLDGILQRYYVAQNPRASAKLKSKVASLWNVLFLISESSKPISIVLTQSLPTRQIILPSRTCGVICRWGLFRMDIVFCRGYQCPRYAIYRDEY